MKIRKKSSGIKKKTKALPRKRKKPLKQTPGKSDKAQDAKTGRFLPDNPYTWKPGQSGNPNGRPVTLSGAYRRKLWEYVPDDPQKRTWAEYIADTLMTRAGKGCIAAAAEIRLATEGNRMSIGHEWEMEALDEGLDPDELKRIVIEGMQKLLAQKKQRATLASKEEQDSVIDLPVNVGERPE